MDNELALRTIGYLIGYYKTHDETMINSQEIEAIDFLLEENQELKKQLEEVEFIVGLRQKRNLISKFDKEYDEEDKKKNPNRDYAGIMPDAEEIYKRYYTMKNQQKEFTNYLKSMLNNDNDYFSVARVKDVLEKYKEIIGDEE